MNYPPIGLTGNLRAGKTTVADYLRTNYEYEEFAFATEMKRFAYEIFTAPPEPKPRELYQWFGQTVRQRDPDVWVRKCFAKINERTHARQRANERAGEIVFEPMRVLISDIKNPNEYERCRAEGFVIIRVKAKSALRVHRAVESADTFNLADLTHETEQYTDGFAVDYEITNDGTIDELYAQIDEVMRKITEVARW